MAKTCLCTTPKGAPSWTPEALEGPRKGRTETETSGTAACCLLPYLTPTFLFLLGPGTVGMAAQFSLSLTRVSASVLSHKEMELLSYWVTGEARGVYFYC